MSTDFSTMKENLSHVDGDPRPCRILAVALDGKFRILYREGRGIEDLDEIQDIDGYCPFEEGPEDGIVVWEGAWEPYKGFVDDYELLGKWRPATPEEWAAYLRDEFVWEIWLPAEKNEEKRLSSDHLSRISDSVVYIEGHEEPESSHDFIYTVTVVVPGQAIFNCACTSFDRARTIIETNEGDLQERWSYFAIIEQIYDGGLYCCPTQYWYVWKENAQLKEMGLEPVAGYGKFLPIEIPEEFKEITVSTVF